MNFENFIRNKIRICNLHLRNFRQIKYCLPTNTRILLVNNFILSTLDYCNSLLICQPQYQIQRLQKLMNKGVRFILDLQFDEHITPFLCQLHFLPVQFRIRYKICLIAHKIVYHIAPEYLVENFKMFQPNENINLRPEIGRDKYMMQINLSQQKKSNLYTKIILEWNGLPVQIRSIGQINCFKTELSFFPK